MPELKQLCAIVVKAAREELLPRFHSRLPAQAGAHGEIKHDGSVVTEADTALQQRLQTELKSHWPQYALLGEEMPLEQQQALRKKHGAGLWCLDPLDGSTNFAAGIPFFAVSLALLQDGVPVLGIVYDPLRDECFSAQQGQGARLNDAPLTVAPRHISLSRSVAVVDFKRLSAPLAASLAQKPPYLSQRNFGSVALEWCWLAAGRFDVYLHGGQKQWDYAAGSLILTEAGGHAETLQGGEVFNPSGQPSSVVAALDGPLFTEWKTWLRAVQQG
ncbi:MAG: inositol monophosphatase family protein [Gammaproteobacteria bacterium]